MSPVLPVADDFVAGREHNPCGFGQWTLTGVRTLDSSTDLTAGTKRLSTCLSKPVRALIQAEAQAIRWVDDPDQDPTAAIGMVIAAGATLEYDGDLSQFRCIAAVAGAIMNVSFYGL